MRAHKYTLLTDRTFSFISAPFRSYNPAHLSETPRYHPWFIFHPVYPVSMTIHPLESPANPWKFRINQQPANPGPPNINPKRWPRFAPVYSHFRRVVFSPRFIYSLRFPRCSYAARYALQRVRLSQTIFTDFKPFYSLLFVRYFFPLFFFLFFFFFFFDSERVNARGSVMRARRRCVYFARKASPWKKWRRAWRQNVRIHRVGIKRVGVCLTGFKGSPIFLPAFLTTKILPSFSFLSFFSFFLFFLFSFTPPFALLGSFRFAETSSVLSNAPK